MDMTRSQVAFIEACLEDIAERLADYDKSENVWDAIMTMCDHEQKVEDWGENPATLGENLAIMAPVLAQMAYLKAFVPFWNFVDSPREYYMEYMVNLYEFLASKMFWLKYGLNADLVGSTLSEMIITIKDVKALARRDIEKFFS
jgi:hypothetical protein